MLAKEIAARPRETKIIAAMHANINKESQLLIKNSLIQSPHAKRLGIPLKTKINAIMIFIIPGKGAVKNIISAEMISTIPYILHIISSPWINYPSLYK